LKHPPQKKTKKQKRERELKTVLPQGDYDEIFELLTIL
jgi:ribosomal protein L35